MVMLLPLSLELFEWLIQQAPVVVVMGAAIFWLAKKLTKSEEDKDSLAKDVIKLTTLWEEKSDKIEERNDEQRMRDDKVDDKIIELLHDIKILVSNKK
jgi:translation initiation factor 2B subunit (eIF-2B alpha/beta/delta family)|tara:strand:- start:4716 stop:5009 length:294 start_codon:yes stop_codon:yes gene_type:complete